MNKRNDEDRIRAILRDAYISAEDTADPSDFLWSRTVLALRNHGLLASGRKPGLRKWIAAVLVGLAFVGGYAVGHDSGRSIMSPAPEPTAVRSADPTRNAELVQSRGTEFVMALEALVENLDDASAAELTTARAVLRAVKEAQAEPVYRLLGPGEPTAPVGESVVWF